MSNVVATKSDHEPQVERDIWIRRLFKFIFSTAAPSAGEKAASPPVVARREKLERASERCKEKMSPRVAAELASLDAMCHGDLALRERLIAAAERLPGCLGRSWAIGKAERDLWRDRR
jgi:hypothetical protein